jgi:hypothetical protein
MWFSSVFTRRKRQRRPARPAHRRPVSTRLTLEALEGRLAPSSLGAGLAARNPPMSALVSSPSSTQQLSFHVDGTFVVQYKHGTDLGATAQGTLTLGSRTLTFTTTVDVKSSGNTIHGAPTFVFSDGSTLTFSYDIKLNNSTGIFSGPRTVTSGTGLFAGATGGGTISYPVAQVGVTGPLTMDGAITV